MLLPDDEMISHTIPETERTTTAETLTREFRPARPNRALAPAPRRASRVRARSFVTDAAATPGFTATALVA